MEKVNVSINKSAFPSQFVPDAEKESSEFGLRIGESIQYEWFKKEGGSSRFYSQQDSFHKKRLYARGEQPVSKYKSELSANGDLSHMNLDWSIISVIPKFVDIVVNGMSDRMFEVKAYSQDSLSISDRTMYKDRLEADMVSSDILTGINESFGVNTFDTDPKDLPQNDEELALHMQLNYKPSIEIAEEQAISTIFDDNKFDDIKRRVDYDIAVIGIGAAKHSFKKGDGISLEYVDPANMVYSYTEDPYFKDCYYWGEVKSVNINEILKIDPETSQKELEEIGKYGRAWDSYNGLSRENSIFDKDTVDLLYFNYKTTKKYKYKKKINGSGTKMIRKEDTFNPPEDMMKERGFEVAEKRIDVWYNGVMVLGSNILIKWELSENMVRPKSASQHAIPNYVAVAPRVYKGVIESLVGRMIPFGDLIQITHLKLQQIIAKTVPDGIFIDADGINEVDLGNGASYNPNDALNLYFQTGSVIGRSFTNDGEFNHGRVPIEQLNNNSGHTKVRSLIESYNHYLNMIRDVTGLNEARDGSTPDPNALVGVQKLAALNSNTATRHILDGSLFITKSLAEAASMRISDVLEYSVFKDEFVMQIGKHNVGVLEDVKDLYIYDFGIFIEVSPDEEEKSMLEQNIQVALAKEGILLEDAIDIREIKNIKVANQLLKLRRKKKADADLKEKMMLQQQQEQANMASQQMAAQTSMQKIDAETNGKIKIYQAQAAFDIEKMNAEASKKAELMEIEFNYNMQLKGIETQGLKDRDNEKEVAKDKRVDKQSTQQSKMIDQRNKDLPPIDFESNEDSLDGFDFSGFDPK